MPKLAMAMNEGTVSEWLVKHGEKVEEGQPLAAIETEKVAYDVEAPTSGYLCILLEVGEAVPCDQLIAYFCESAEEVVEMAAAARLEDNSGTETATADSVTTTPTVAGTEMSVSVALDRTTGQRIIASPLAKKIARDNNLDLLLVDGTGPSGRIVKRDIVAALERGLQHSSASNAMTIGGNRELARIPITGIRKTIGERMVKSLHTAAQLSSGWESDITDMLAARQKFVARAEQLGTKVSVNAFIIKAIVYAIHQVPMANACEEGSDIVVYENINMGIAISMPGATDYDSGLMVAVLRNVEHMGLVEIDQKMKALINRVRNGEGSADDMSGSTITLSSTAGIAPPGMTTTPILNLPNAALVGPSTPIEKPVVHNGEIVARTMMPVSFTFDHRLMDGAPAARFMAALHEALENPELMLA
ncbi:MAG TPA: 2-oxo acid dehydrogenase subunit E2 [Porticoccus sp.]|nr:2-oxo acid dehydrogenase subunit E2 [Porticoccus sp.]